MRCTIRYSLFSSKCCNKLCGPKHLRLSELTHVRQTTTDTSVGVSLGSVTSFKSAKEKKKKTSSTENADFKKSRDKYFAQVSEEEKRRIREMEETFQKVSDMEQMQREKQKKLEEDEETKLFRFAHNKMREYYLARTAKANPVIWTLRAQAKAWELHKSNPKYWNPTRLANTFKTSPLRVRLSLWHSKLIEQAKADNYPIDDRVEREIEQLKFLQDQGLVRDIPNDLPEIPEEIGLTAQHAGQLWYYIDGNVKSDELIKFIRRQSKVYRESPKIPKKEIPPVKYLPMPQSPYAVPQVYPKKHLCKYIIWDISKCYDLYNRPIVVRDRDGRWRTGNWEERRWAEDFRRYIKYPYPIPFIKPDESQPDRMHPDHRPPEDFKINFDVNPTI
jgi:hypothetical protein